MSDYTSSANGRERWGHQAPSYWDIGEMKQNPDYSLELINELTLEEAIFLSVETYWLEAELKSNGREILKGNSVVSWSLCFCSGQLDRSVAL